jgi:hypothetical protein
MNNVRKVLLFKVNGEVVIEDSINLNLTEIDNVKEDIAICFEIPIDSIEVVISEEKVMSDIDVSIDGLICWTDVVFEPYKGLTLPFNEGSDEHLDAIKKGNLIDYVKFI